MKQRMHFNAPSSSTLKHYLLLSCATLIFALSACAPSEPKDKPESTTLRNASDGARHSQPNIVLILIDDLSHYGVSAYGSKALRSVRGRFKDQDVSTHNIDALAESGLRVNNAFAFPLCENTRIALMSGRNNDQNYLKPKSQHASDITFGDVFQRAGYRTGLFGKWKQTRGTREIPGRKYISEFGWDEYTAFDVITEGQRFINPSLVIDGVVTDYQGRTDLDPVTGRRWYGPDIINRHALAFIDNNKTRPFFLYYPMVLVHDDHKPTPDTRPKSIFDNFDEANHNNNGHRGDDPKYMPDMIRYMDKLIGKVVKKIEDTGLREKTLIIVMGDNGTKENYAHILHDGTVYPARKGGNADNGLHVPLILSQPGRIPSLPEKEIRSYDGLVNVTDIFPTIAEAAGLTIPNADSLDGISFWPQALGAKGEPRQYIHNWFIANETYKDEHMILRYAFNKHFKRYAPDLTYPEGRFFDLRTDLLERTGDRFTMHRWNILRYSGLAIDTLTPEQRVAYDELGRILDNEKIVRVETLSIASNKTLMQIGEKQRLNAQVLPLNATRRNVIWQSSNPNIASINKYGEITAHTKGEVTISVYSWDDAEPHADKRAITYKRDGIQASLNINIM